jgi:hypothetical protein
MELLRHNFPQENGSPIGSAFELRPDGLLSRIDLLSVE